MVPLHMASKLYFGRTGGLRSFCWGWWDYIQMIENRIVLDSLKNICCSWLNNMCRTFADFLLSAHMGRGIGEIMFKSLYSRVKENFLKIL